MTLPKDYDPSKFTTDSRKKTIYDYGKTITIVGAIMLGIGIISLGILLGDMQTIPKSAFISGYDIHPSIPEYRTIFASKENLRIKFNVEPLYVPLKILILNEDQVIFDKTFSGHLNETLTVSTGKKYDIMAENLGTENAYVFGSIINVDLASEFSVVTTIFTILLLGGVVGLFVLIMGLLIWPNDFQSKNEKKVLRIIGFVVLFTVIGGIATPFALSINGCLEIKNNYEINPEIAIEKYRYDTFEEWLIGGAPGNLSQNCVPIINPPENLLV